MLADSITNENAEEVYPITVNLQNSVSKQQWLIVPERDDEVTTNAYSFSTIPIASAKRYENTKGLKAALNEIF